jgi:hypothetical protein
MQPRRANSEVTLSGKNLGHCRGAIHLRRISRRDGQQQTADLGVTDVAVEHLKRPDLGGAIEMVKAISTLGHGTI